MTGTNEYEQANRNQSSSTQEVPNSPQYTGCLCFRKKVKAPQDLTQSLSVYDPEKEKKAYLAAMTGWKKVKKIVLALKLGAKDEMIGNIPKMASEKRLCSYEKWQIMPNGGFKTWWDLGFAFTLLYWQILLPIRIVFGYFDQDSWFSYTDMCVQLIWLCNILLNFFMMFIDNQQKLEKRFGKILRKYLTSYFIGDLCSILPWYVLGSSSARKSMYWVTATCFLRTGFVNGIVYQFQNKIFMKFTTDIHFVRSLSRIITFFVVFFVGANIMACLWCEIGLEEFPNEIGWIYTLLADGGTIDLDDVTKYITSIYWVFTTLSTLGYGDFYPTNNEEYLYTILVEFMGVFVFAYIMGNINSLIANIDADQNEYIETMIENLEDWMMRIDTANPHRHLPVELITKIKEGLKTYWELDHQIILADTFYKELPGPLKKELVNFCFGDFKDRFSVFFQDLEEEFIENILINLYPKRFRQNDVILRYENSPKFLALINKGTVVIEAKGNSEQYVQYSEGSYFGDYHILFKVKTSYIYRVSSEEVELMTIDKSKFVEICELFPKSAKILRQRAYYRRKFIRDRADLAKELRYLRMNEIKQIIEDNNHPNEPDLTKTNHIYDNEGINPEASKLKKGKLLKIIENPYKNFDELADTLFDSEEEDFEELADEEKLDLAKRNHELIKNTKSLSDNLDVICNHVNNMEEQFKNKLDSLKYDVDFISNFKEYRGNDAS